MKKILFLLIAVIFVNCTGSSQQTKNGKAISKNENDMSKYAITKTEQEWKEQLSPEQYKILRQKGTEMPHTGEYNLHFGDGEYRCAACDAILFEGDSKFKSNCGWPSFDEAKEGAIEYVQDRSLGMVRTEILCANCGGHIGHVFDDGPTETGQRYCVNSASIDYKE